MGCRRASEAESKAREAKLNRALDEIEKYKKLLVEAKEQQQQRNVPEPRVDLDKIIAGEFPYLAFRLCRSFTDIFHQAFHLDL